MKSKRKQINKYTFKSQEYVKQSQVDQYLQRTSGNKPFQLAKLRQMQRYSVDLAHINNQLLHKRSGSNNLSQQDKQATLELIIKQKLLNDNISKNKNETQRKKIHINQQQNNTSPIRQILQKDNIITQEYIQQDSINYNNTIQSIKECIKIQNNQYLYNKQQKNNIEQQNKKNKCKNCDCCQHLLTNSIYSIICTKNNNNNIKQNNKIIYQQEINQSSKNQIKLLKQKTLPPFSFTSTKWRSKSQILQIDKWKQKYGKQKNDKYNIDKISSTTKLQKQKLRTSRINQVKSYINSLQKVSLPMLRKQKQLQFKANINKFYPIYKQQDKITNIQYQPQKTINQENNKKHSSQSKRKIKQLQQKQTMQIKIKKMYQQAKQAQELKNQQQQQILQIKQQINRPKKKKSKFPQIQITTFYSTKQQQIQKRKQKLENLQKISRQWRYQPPKKIYLQKMLQEIPQRWQYGGSRQSSRQGQVDSYMKIKQQQAKQQQILHQLEVKKLQLQLQKQPKELQQIQLIK